LHGVVPREARNQPLPRIVKVGADRDGVLRHGVREGQPFGMQQQPVRTEVLLEKAVVVTAPVLAIPHDRVVDMREVLADLAETTCPRLGDDQRVALLLITAQRDVDLHGG
jgi:hypothetical protein